MKSLRYIIVAGALSAGLVGYVNAGPGTADQRGDRIDTHLDNKGDRINSRLDYRATLAAENGHDKLAEHLDNQGDRIDTHLDNKGDSINQRLDGVDGRHENLREKFKNATPEERQAMKQKLAERMKNMTPEQRQRLKAHMQELRERRQQASAGKDTETSTGAMQ